MACCRWVWNLFVFPVWGSCLPLSVILLPFDSSSASTSSSSSQAISLPMLTSAMKPCETRPKLLIVYFFILILVVMTMLLWPLVFYRCYILLHVLLPFILLPCSWPFSSLSSPLFVLVLVFFFFFVLLLWWWSSSWWCCYVVVVLRCCFSAVVILL